MNTDHDIACMRSGSPDQLNHWGRSIQGHNHNIVLPASSRSWHSAGRSPVGNIYDMTARRNYNKNRRPTVGFKPKQRVWVRNFPLSKSKEKFTAKLAKKWNGPYRVVQQLGPLNYQVVLEDTGLDVRTVHVCNLKPFYPSAEDLEKIERKKILDLLQESSEEEDFLGF